MPWDAELKYGLQQFDTFFKKGMRMLFFFQMGFI